MTPPLSPSQSELFTYLSAHFTPDTLKHVETKRAAFMRKYGEEPSVARMMCWAYELQPPRADTSIRLNGPMIHPNRMPYSARFA